MSGGKAVEECGGYDLNAPVLSSSTKEGGESIEEMDRDTHNAGFFAGGGSKSISLTPFSC